MLWVSPLRVLLSRSFSPNRHLRGDDPPSALHRRCRVTSVRPRHHRPRRPQLLDVACRSSGSSFGTGRVELADDPADHRGVLSWHAQPRDRRLREAGSYGYLVNIALPRSAIEAAAAKRQIELRLEVSDSLPGGLAIYGAQFGRYPLDPSILFSLRDAPPGH